MKTNYEKVVEGEVEMFQKIRTNAITEMFENKYADGIYPTSVFFEKLDSAVLSAMQKAYEAGLHEHFHVMDKNMSDWLKENTEGVKMVEDIKKEARNKTLEEVGEEIKKEESRWNSGGEYYANVTKALSSLTEIINKLKK